MTRDSTTKRKESDESGVGRVALRYSSGLQQRRESRKKRSSRRSDGGDSPMSSSSAEEYERATEMDGAKLTPSKICFFVEDLCKLFVFLILFNHLRFPKAYNSPGFS